MPLLNNTGGYNSNTYEDVKVGFFRLEQASGLERKTEIDREMERICPGITYDA